MNSTEAGSGGERINAHPREMKQLWRYTIHYLRNEKNIHNLLYAFNTDKFSSGDEYLERYPGDDLIDILGFDIYQGDTLKEQYGLCCFFRKGPEPDR